MRIMRARFVLLGFVISAAALLVPACGSDSEGTIQIYTGRHYDLEAAFEAFSDEFNIDIEFLEGADADLRERITAEGEDTQADVYMTVTPATRNRRPGPHLRTDRVGSRRSDSRRAAGRMAIGTP